jgi:regulator of replication initiation timing
MPNIDRSNIFSLINEISKLKSDPAYAEKIQAAEFLGKVEATLREVAENISQMDSVISINVSDISLLKGMVDRLLQEKPIKEIENSFLKTILNRTEILKNIIKAATDNDDGTLYSVNLVMVESIEEDIIKNNSVTKDQLRKLNEIHKQVSEPKKTP